MGLLDWFQQLIGRGRQRYTQARMLEGYAPVFSQFGQDVYASDIVQMAIDRIASEVSKLQPRHIRTDADGLQTVPKSGLNRLFRFAPNPLMTTRDFLEKVVWLLYRNFNAFVYPMYDLVSDSRGQTSRDYTALYPLDPTQVRFLQDATGTLFVDFWFASGDKFILPYADVIHLRKRFSTNSVMGGGLNGQPDNDALLRVLRINDTVMQGLEKAIKATLGVRGILKINTLMDDEKQRAEREKFEAAIRVGESGIIPLDLKGEFIDLKPNPKVVDRETLDFIERRILAWYGVPLTVLTGEFTDEDYQSFYETTLEPLIIALGQAFTTVLFTERELDFGNELVFYHRNTMYLSTRSKLDLIKIAGEQGLLTDNQKLALLGYPPVPDGSRRTISLNYIDVNLAAQYQLQRVSDNQEPRDKPTGEVARHDHQD